MADAMRFKVDSAGVEKLLAELGRQAPFAAMVALNRTAEDVLAEQRANIRDRFIVRQPKFVLPPQKLPREWAATKKNLEVFMALGPQFDPMAVKRRNILEPFEVGEPKRMGKYPVAIPTSYARPTRSGLVPRKLYPRNLVGIFNSDGTLTGMGTKARMKTRTYKTKAGVKTSSKQVGRYFVLGDSNSRSWGIYERTGANSLRKLWNFRTSVSRPRVLEFLPTAMRVIAVRWAPNLTGAIDLAIRTAKGAAK